MFCTCWFLTFYFPKYRPQIFRTRRKRRRDDAAGQIFFRNETSMLLLESRSLHKHIKNFDKLYNFFLLQTLIQSFQGFLSFLPFSPSLSPSLPSLPSSFTSFLFLRSGGEDATPLLAAIYKYKTKGTFPLWICLLDCLLFNWSLGKSLEFF